MKQFTMSMYPSREYMLESQAKYYQALCERLLQHLVNTEDVRFGEEYGEWYWSADGGRVDEGL